MNSTTPYAIESSNSPILELKSRIGAIIDNLKEWDNLNQAIDRIRRELVQCETIIEDEASKYVNYSWIS